jgi:hypothetical protein
LSPSSKDEEIFQLFYAVNGGPERKQPTYTTVKEFTPTFPKKTNVEFVPEKPYPVIKK